MTQPPPDEVARCIEIIKTKGQGDGISRTELYHQFKIYGGVVDAAIQAGAVEEVDYLTVKATSAAISEAAAAADTTAMSDETSLAEPPEPAPRDGVPVESAGPEPVG